MHCSSHVFRATLPGWFAMQVPLLDRLSTAIGVHCTIPEIKSIWRVLEKLVLRPGQRGNGIIANFQQMSAIWFMKYGSFVRLK